MNRRAFLKTTLGAAALAAAPDSNGQEVRPPIQRYPDPAVETVDPRFAPYRVGSSAVERLYTGTAWAEGPVWFGDGRFLLWSDIPNNRVMRWVEETGEVSVFSHSANNSNGHTRDREGRLITCERRRLTRTEPNGTVTVLIERFEGKRLNSPNDAVVHPDGHVWFTDPGYGILSIHEGRREPFELPTNVYRLDPESGKATVVTVALERPNGLCFSPQYDRLYIADTGASPERGHPQQIMVFDVVGGERLENGRSFCNMAPGFADGIRCDADGNLWSSAGWAGPGYDGVHVFAPDGILIGKIHLPEVCANLCFGGEKNNRLFMTASQSLYAVYVETQGAQVW